jgi:hypothetical protein
MKLQQHCGILQYQSESSNSISNVHNDQQSDGYKVNFSLLRGKKNLGDLLQTEIA